MSPICPKCNRPFNTFSMDFLYFQHGDITHVILLQEVHRSSFLIFQIKEFDKENLGRRENEGKFSDLRGKRKSRIAVINRIHHEFC